MGNLLIRNNLIIMIIRWTGLAPWEFEFPFSGSLTFMYRRSSIEYIRPVVTLLVTARVLPPRAQRESFVLTTYWSETTYPS